ncbi:hypothetical protein EG103P2_00002 [Enterococcus phage EG103P2]|nr:hypothetical protein EG103P2_00002 [Enterococcus phage EG103P2]
MNNTEIIMTVAVGIGAIMTGLMNMIKSQEYIPTRYIPLAAIVLGVIVGVAGGMIVFDVEPVIGAVAGLIAGLSSVGFYETGKSVNNAINK